MWLNFAKLETQPPKTRLALRQVTECTDWLLAKRNFDGHAEPEAVTLASDEARLRSDWLVACLLYLSASIPTSSPGAN